MVNSPLNSTVILRNYLLAFSLNSPYHEYMSNTTRPNLAELLAGLDSPLQPFTESDWSAFAGCTTESPMIGRGELPGIGCYTMIFDGSQIQVIGEQDEVEESSFWLSRWLPVSLVVFPR